MAEGGGRPGRHRPRVSPGRALDRLEHRDAPLGPLHESCGAWSTTLRNAGRYGTASRTEVTGPGRHRRAPATVQPRPRYPRLSALSNLCVTGRRGFDRHRPAAAEGDGTAPAGTARPRSRTSKAQGKRYMRHIWLAVDGGAGGPRFARRTTAAAPAGAGSPRRPGRGVRPRLSMRHGCGEGGFRRAFRPRGARPYRPPVTPAAGAGDAPGRSGPGRGQKGRGTPYGTNPVPVYPIRPSCPLKQRLTMRALRI